jgi:hypothetical protein
VNEVFSKISKYWNDGESLKFSELKEATENTLEALDLLWTKSEAYNEQDMTRLIENLSEAIIQKLSTEFK